MDIFGQPSVARAAKDKKRRLWGAVAIHKGGAAAELKKNQSHRFGIKGAQKGLNQPATPFNVTQRPRQMRDHYTASTFFFRADGPRDMSIDTRGVFIAFASPPMSDLSSRVVDLVAPAKAKEKKKKKKSGAKDREWKEPPSESVTRDSPVGN